MLGQNGTSCSLIGPASFSRIFFRCLIFNCYNISICKKEKIKDETSKKSCETNGGQLDLQRLHEVSLDVSSLIVTTSAPKKIRETNGGQIEEHDVPLT